MTKMTPPAIISGIAHGVAALLGQDRVTEVTSPGWPVPAMRNPVRFASAFQSRLTVPLPVTSASQRSEPAGLGTSAVPSLASTVSPPPVASPVTRAAAESPIHASMLSIGAWAIVRSPVPSAVSFAGVS